MVEKRPRIIITTEEKKVTDAAEDALAGRSDVYVRGNVLVHITVGRGKFSGLLLVNPLPRARLREMLAESVDWFKISKKGELLPVHVPPWVVSALLARGKWPKFRQVDCLLQK